MLATAVYYFARYYFRTHDKDQEVVPKLREEAPALQKDLVRETATLELVKEEKHTAEDRVEPKAPIAESAPVKPLEKPREEKPAPVKDLRSALANTRSSMFGRFKEALLNKPRLSEDDFEYLEEVLYTSDLGPHTVQRLVEAIGNRLSAEDRADLEKVRLALKNEMLTIFSELNEEHAGDPEFKEMDAVDKFIKQSAVKHKPLVWMVVGVNGAGKTTSIGKLASRAQSIGLKTLVVAGDTFRAAAEDQLKIWSERAGADTFSPEGVKDPSAVVFDGLAMAKSKDYDFVIIDTAGRLHTQTNLMEELKKMKRVMEKVAEGTPHEVMLVLDANSGQNAMVQAKTFSEALDVTGVVLTKLDGTAKGGVAVGLAYELGLPIRLIGVGEGVEDLRPFHHQEFVDSII
ncbi:MAG: signal recognition particle-docking protein FtsY [Pseudobdellovibrionaceae bacterium]|nr:signal recognition particle-docking protein FtsY [Bdellovibrionales bacterium]USN48906.1 MAG: signal recognition particle-docking protein FtsY [Pseudobdellovibrionaceae bacterium]